MNMIKSMEKLAIYRDGGTIKARVVMDTGEQEVYIDNRLGSLIKGEVFDQYPGRESTPSKIAAQVKEYLKANPL